MQVIKVWTTKAYVCVRLSVPYILPEEQGLRLWEAYKGSKQEKISDRDHDDVYFAPHGMDNIVFLLLLFGPTPTT